MVSLQQIYNKMHEANNNKPHKKSNKMKKLLFTCCLAAFCTLSAMAQDNIDATADDSTAVEEPALDNPVIQAILAIPVSGTDFPLEPGEDAVIALNGAIDHTAEYPLSVNLNRPDVFALYDSVLFPNATYHPAPGPLVQAARYLDIIIKTGQANAYTLSVNSPTFILFRAPSGTDIRDYVQQAQNQPQVPGSSEKVIAIPQDWVVDGVEVFNGGSSGNQKRIPATIDAGAVSLSETFKGRTLMRKADESLSAEQGFEVLQDTNNSTEDFYERETQSLHQ